MVHSHVHTKLLVPQSSGVRGQVYPSPSARDMFNHKLPLTSRSRVLYMMNTPGGYGTYIK